MVMVLILHLSPPYSSSNRLLPGPVWSPLMLVDRCEQELILRAQHGEAEALASLYDSHAGRVYGYLYKRVEQPADAEDITADVFVQAMQALPSFELTGAPFGAWLIRIAHNLAVNHQKKQSRRQEVALLNGDAPLAADPAELALQQITFEEVSAAMEQLTELQRQVIEFRFLRQLTIAETADRMGRAKGAVKFLQHSALRALRRSLGYLEMEIN
jgi:RNA polymerase sigma-70 factor (ECF subfamily)